MHDSLIHVGKWDTPVSWWISAFIAQGKVNEIFTAGFALWALKEKGLFSDIIIFDICLVRWDAVDL